MAKPISTIDRIVVDEETKHQRDVEEIETALAENKEAVLETIELLGNLYDRGVLETLNGFFSQGEQVLQIIVQEINKPGHSQVLENLVGLAGILGSIDMDQLKTFTEKANNGLQEATESDTDDGPSSIFQLMKVLKDPEINRSVGMLLKFLKGMGKE
ncbi:MAG TPA: DUF1641 domain-containing protein [Bacillales bacterium]|nr:DUF1641 domain-containing protein [Bacillales bacterium]